MAENEYIERHSVLCSLAVLLQLPFTDLSDAWEAVQKTPAADVAEVRHGEWLTEVHSFYADTWDESCELIIYIIAKCNECDEKHPNCYQVFSKHLYAPEDANDDFRFDEEAEKEKALAEFVQSGYKYANYCPNCGARMDGGNHG